MIESIPRFKGPSIAKVTCDLCLKSETVMCGYVNVGQPNARPNERQCIGRVTTRGWSHIKKILRCPACEAKRKPPKTKWLQAAEDHIKQEARMRTMNTIAKTEPTAQLRQPTPDQELDIIEALLTCYDRKAKRYVGADTDKTVAESIGGGIMPGWVAQIREAKFGPSGGNEEIDAIRAEIATMVSKAALERDKQKAEADRQHAAIIDTARALEKRINVICAAVGPKARGV